MEKFKFVYLHNYGASAVIAQSSVLTLENKDDQESNVKSYGIALSECGHLAMVPLDDDVAGNSSHSSEYSFSADYLNLGPETEITNIIASLRSLADEIEKTLDAAQS